MKLCFDIDDTILYSKLDNENYILMGHNAEMVSEINKSYDNGVEIIIQTGRHWNHLSLTIKQLKKIGLKYTTLIMGNPVCDFYINDKAMRPGEFLNGFK